MREAELDESSIQKVLGDMEQEGFFPKSFQVLEDSVVIKFRTSAAKDCNYLWFEADSSEAGNHLKNYDEQGWILLGYDASNGKVYFLFFKGCKDGNRN